MNFFIGLFMGLIGTAIAVPIFLAVCRAFGLYTTVNEGHCKVFVLFGKVIGVLREPGISFPVTKFGPGALLIPFFGKVYEIDIRIDQEYLRSQPVNSEEGTPMGIGVWYEMHVTEPVDFLFKNNDPRGSLRANVSNAGVRCLSNMPLDNLLASRHGMSRAVRHDVSPKSDDWGYKLGSVYIRKVHFRDDAMIHQIEQKVANRLLQVTSAIRQAGANQVDVVMSAAEKEAAFEFARARSMRPQVVGAAMQDVARDPAVLDALLEILEIQGITRSDAKLTLVPSGGSSALLTDLLVARDQGDRPDHKASTPTGSGSRHADGTTWESLHDDGVGH